MTTKDATTTVDLNAVMEQCYSRVPKLGGEIVTVEALVDAIYCWFDPRLTAPIEIQRLSLRQLDALALKFCQKRDGDHYRLFDEERWYWSGEWTEGGITPYPIRTWIRKALRAVRA